MESNANSDGDWTPKLPAILPLWATLRSAASGRWTTPRTRGSCWCRGGRGVTEIIDLEEPDRVRLMAEISAVATALKGITQCDKAQRRRHW